MIEFEDVDGWWSDFSALVSFDPSVLQELLYGQAARSSYERRLLHGDVAAALEQLIGTDDRAPRQALLEVARQYELAGKPVQAATRLVRVAETTFAEGADYETALHAGKALALLRTDGARDGSAEVERLFARAALLVLLGGEPSWRAETGGGERLSALAAEAEHAADAAGDDLLRVEARFAAAQLALAYEGLESGVAAYDEVVASARQAGDAVTEFAALLKLGHHRGSLDLREGATALEEARAVLESGRLAERLGPNAITLEQGRLESALGVAKFDLGDYGEADRLLERSVRILSATRLDDDYAWALCFRGQLETALGLWDEAEATLREAIAVFDEVRRALGARGYFLALLGRVALERDPPQLDVARAALEAGRRETHDAKYVSVRPLVDVFWAELLLAQGSESARLEADELLEGAPNYGWVRGEIAMGALRARIALRDERLDDALDLSRAAYDRLAQLGGFVPAVRSEEIVFTHARVLDAVGSAEAAAVYAEVEAILRAKADSLTDPAQRDSLLQRVRLSREILAAAR
jgi:tetratricopeptide (TPR) repeat protein